MTTNTAPLYRTGPALGLVEVASVARGMVVADAMVKRQINGRWVCEWD